LENYLCAGARQSGSAPLVQSINEHQQHSACAGTCWKISPLAVRASGAAKAKQYRAPNLQLRDFSPTGRYFRF